jgi:hypothetical protein
MFDIVAHGLRRDYRFFGDGDIGGAGGDNGNSSLSINRAIFAQQDATSELVVFGFRNAFADGGILRGLAAGSEDIAFMAREPRKDFGGLRGSFAAAENNFRESGAQGAMMIELGEAEIFKRKMAQAVERLVRRELAAADLLQEFVYGGSIHL